jgi:hypothetical protein
MQTTDELSKALGERVPDFECLVVRSVSITIVP